MHKTSLEALARNWYVRLSPGVGTGGLGQGWVGTSPSLYTLCTVELGALFPQYLFLKVTFTNHRALWHYYSRFTFFLPPPVSLTYYSPRKAGCRAHEGTWAGDLGQGESFQTKCLVLLTLPVPSLSSLRCHFSLESLLCVQSKARCVCHLRSKESEPSFIYQIAPLVTWCHTSRVVPAHLRCSVEMPQSEIAGAIP